MHQMQNLQIHFVLQVMFYPVVVEAFYNHGGSQLKCYIIRDECFVLVEPSFPDVSEATGQNGAACLIGGHTYPCSPPFVFRFHSLDSMPKASSRTVVQSGIGNFDAKCIQDCAAEIGARTGLTVFGFDLIRTCGNGVANYLLIDVNAFPSFKGVPEAPYALRRCMKSLCRSVL
jgi:hypothetical protein